MAQKTFAPGTISESYNGQRRIKSNCGRWVGVESVDADFNLLPLDVRKAKIDQRIAEIGRSLKGKPKPVKKERPKKPEKPPKALKPERFKQEPTKHTRIERTGGRTVRVNKNTEVVDYDNRTDAEVIAAYNKKMSENKKQW